MPPTKPLQSHVGLPSIKSDNSFIAKQNVAAKNFLAAYKLAIAHGSPFEKDIPGARRALLGAMLVGYTPKQMMALANPSASLQVDHSVPDPIQQGLQIQIASAIEAAPYIKNIVILNEIDREKMYLVFTAIVNGATLSQIQEMMNEVTPIGVTVAGNTLMDKIIEYGSEKIKSKSLIKAQEEGFKYLDKDHPFKISEANPYDVLATFFAKYIHKEVF